MADRLDADELLLTAYHEAGHFVAGCALGHFAEDSTVTIVPEGDCLGSMTMRHHVIAEVDHFEGLVEIDRGRVEVAAVRCYAGHAAALRFCPELAEQLGGHDEDNEQAERLLQAAGIATDADRLRLRRRAADLVERHWAQVERLAAELVRRGTLKGDEALRVVSEGGASQLDREREERRKEFEAEERRRDRYERWRELERAGYDTDYMDEDELERAYARLAGIDPDEESDA